LAALGTLSVLLTSRNGQAQEQQNAAAGAYGVLVDTTVCIGCRSCEQACNQINQDLPRRRPDYFKDYTVFTKERRMNSGTYTVVNRYEKAPNPAKPVFVKFQCMHCLSPACMSACIVAAYTKEPQGAVRYDPWKCIGCRYCLAACPFQVPAYEYGNAFAPQVRKCTFCFDQRLSKGKVPACVQACPMQVMTFGNRSELITIGRERINKYPGQYLPHIYGEHEVGGTSWLYLSNVPFEQIGLPKFGYAPIPGYTEPIQHALFKYFLPPVALYGLLGGIMWFLKPKKEKPKPAPDE